MNEFEIWLYRGVILSLLAIVWYFAKGILVQLKEMNATLKTLNDKSLILDGNLELVREKVNNHEGRLNNHGERIKAVEHKQDICNACPV